MSDACGCTTSTPAENTHGARYQFWDNALILPILSGLLLVLGVITEGRVPGTVHQLFFWASLVAGGITFVPDALKRLVLPGRRLRQRLSIGLLMTISRNWRGVTRIHRRSSSASIPVFHCGNLGRPGIRPGTE